MAPHSSTLAWKIPWTEEPGKLCFLHYAGFEAIFRAELKSWLRTVRSGQCTREIQILQGAGNHPMGNATLAI